MKSITMYETKDGTVCASLEQALAHEALVTEVDAIMAVWPVEPDDGCNFANGHGYFQLSGALVAGVRDALLDIIEREHAGWETARDYVAKTRSGEAHPSWMSRLLDDSGPEPVRRAWYRLMCVDSEWRWWGQPYYANNPGGDMVCLGTVTPMVQPEPSVIMSGADPVPRPRPSVFGFADPGVTSGSQE